MGKTLRLPGEDGMVHVEFQHSVFTKSDLFGSHFVAVEVISSHRRWLPLELELSTRTAAAGGSHLNFNSQLQLNPPQAD